MNSNHPQPRQPQPPQKPLPGVGQDVFQAVGGNIPHSIPSREDHPVKPEGRIVSTLLAILNQAKRRTILGRPQLPAGYQ